MRILCPLDRSTRDSTTLRYAKDLATGLNGTILVASIVPTGKLLLKAAVAQTEGYVSAVESGLREEGFEVEGLVRKGETPKVIVNLVTEAHVDMVVMTTRNRSGMTKAVMGSVTRDVLLNSPKPVLLLKEDQQASLSEEDVELQSAYIAAVLWNKRLKGELTKEEVTDEMVRLSQSGLDRNVLYQTYMGYEEAGKPLEWLDFSFQMNTLNKFLPQDTGDGEQAPATDESHAA